MLMYTQISLPTAPQTCLARSPQPTRGPIGGPWRAPYQISCERRLLALVRLVGLVGLVGLYADGQQPA